MFQVAATLNGVNYDSSTHTIAPPSTASTTNAAGTPTASYHHNHAAPGRVGFTSFPLLQYLGVPGGGDGGFIGAILLVIVSSALGTVL